MKKTVVLLISILGFSLSSFARPDIDQKMSLLDENVKNAEENFKNFKENMAISVKNFNEATRVVNELRGLKKQALRDTKRAETNSLVLGQVMGKYNEFIATEQANILKEEEALTKLQSLMDSLKQNIEQRRGIIAGYTAEVDKTQQEINSWRDKKREVASVIEDIASREAGALAERENWS